ncbi:GNAT family N-acetyltransferase [Promethearchaeum syntrophicum]|uniref:GNAT family N-acetyltransferase n=1 Tax=Promethearchaeum syntrophicum TaxID=2594042 RepID=A0A5B9D9V6_9ARCH|nr:GNAT family N-acetyltransferase [Candidatus Prometheoarchaeum syntrophicum]QEE15617.1 Acetyltransferase (GNAT) family protein [Candidatus Prometheoarchaeum syntrophicum]
MQEKFIIREVSLKDISDFLNLRRIMFESMEDSGELLEKSLVKAKNYFRKTIPTGEFKGWIVDSPSQIGIASGGLVIDQHPPSSSNMSGKQGYVMNLVVIEEYRRQGIGKMIMETIIKWLKTEHIEKVTLHASDMGLPLYQELGFKHGTEMWKKI